MMISRKLPLFAALVGLWAFAQGTPAQAASKNHAERFHALVTLHQSAGNSASQNGGGGGAFLNQGQIDRYARAFQHRWFNIKRLALFGIPRSQILTAENDYVVGLQQAEAQLRSDLSGLPRNDRADRATAYQNFLFTVNGLQLNFFNELFFGSATPSA